jgi:hypothetical protein
MGYKKQQRSIDNGEYSRLRNPKTGKVEGITKVSSNVGRNEKCPCGSEKKFKSCCLPNGVFFRNNTRKTQGVKLASMKINLKRLFTKR